MENESGAIYIFINSMIQISSYPQQTNYNMARNTFQKPRRFRSSTTCNICYPIISIYFFGYFIRNVFSRAVKVYLTKLHSM